MTYLTQANDIKTAIAQYTQARILWLDTEVADYHSSKPKLSLIQVLDDSTDLSGDRVNILDVLEQPQLIEMFIENIMFNPAIEKVFHNANYDCQFLGKRKVKKVTCTREMVSKIPYYIVPIPNYQLKTLAEKLCHFPPIDKTEQSSDWGRRPLTQKQLQYATMDVVYVAQVHHRLLQLSQLIAPNPATENISALTTRYRQILDRWKILDTEIQHLKERLKKAMDSQQTSDINGFHLIRQTRKTKKVSLNDLAKIVQASGIEFNLSLKLTQDMQEELEEILEKLPVEEIQDTTFMLKIKEVEDEDNLPF